MPENMKKEFATRERLKSEHRDAIAPDNVRRLGKQIKSNCGRDEDVNHDARMHTKHLHEQIQLIRTPKQSF